MDKCLALFQGSAWEEERSSLQEETRSLRVEIDLLASTNADLESALDGAAWKEEREELVSALEEAKDRWESWCSLVFCSPGKEQS